MRTKFFRDIKLIKFCKVCKVEYRPPRGSFAAASGLCYVHRKIFTKESFAKWNKRFWARMTPEQRKAYRKKQQKNWLNWVIKNIDRRRKQALESYHRKKHLHKSRKHRRTRAT